MHLATIKNCSTTEKDEDVNYDFKHRLIVSDVTFFHLRLIDFDHWSLLQEMTITTGLSNLADENYQA